MPAAVDKFLSGLIRDGQPIQVCLIHGDLVLAVPAAERAAETLARTAGVAVESHRHPPSLSPLLQDLRTFSLFASAKVLLAVDTAVLADRSAAAELIDDAQEALPFTGDPGRALSGRERQAASRLLQALHLFDMDPYAGPADRAVAELPAWVLEGGKRGKGGSKRTKKQVDELRTGLAALLESARTEGLQGQGEGALAELTDVVRGGLPAGHCLVLAERTVATDHPVVQLLAERGAVLAVGELESERGGGWQGLDLLAGELERQTGVAIATDALNELARRTLRKESAAGGRKGEGVDSDSTARLAGEYRKLAQLAGEGGKIDRKLVEQSVEDRGEEDVWQLLDAISAGRPGEALDRLGRLIGSADDPLVARLTFLSLFGSFCRHLTAIRGMMKVARVPGGESNFARFKDRLAPALQGAVPTGGKNPLAGIHPFRLHKAYLAASRLTDQVAAKLPAELLDTEMQIKGESSEADVALSRLVARLCTAVAAGGAGGSARPQRR